MSQTVQPTLHDCYHASNLTGFKELLHPATSNNKRSVTLSSSLSRSPNSRYEHLHPTNAPSSVINRRDLQGRTVLHLAVSKPDERNLEFVHTLLACPTINVNLQDYESGWTALHRSVRFQTIFSSCSHSFTEHFMLAISSQPELLPQDRTAIHR